ncbi:GGDEF domain-containing protein [Magnetococcus sp. PR-3]|uniref:GGDEF domain-containing protein n=1 Tax=Magnetococcus sp. PR-3 TaxID=3120355 RepID=UPI002FCE114A
MDLENTHLASNLSMLAANIIERSLSEQMKITDLELEKRKRRLDFTKADVDRLTECKELVAANVDKVVAEFYRHLTKLPEVQLIIGDQETFRRLKNSLRNYIIELFEGYYDRDYLNKRLRIGKIHERIGVSPSLYVTAVARLENILQSMLLNDAKSGKACKLCDARRDSLHKLLMLDMQLVFDTYIHSLINEVNSAKEEVERYAESLEETVAQRTKQLEELSTRDGLTGLLNQRTFHTVLRRELSRAERIKQPITLVYFDLNKFKRVNDTIGHKAGDQVLSNVGKAVERALHDDEGSGFRYGGDEFALIMPDQDIQQAYAICKKLCDAYDPKDNHGVSFSIGLAQQGPEDYCDLDSFIHHADSNMYHAKGVSRQKQGHQMYDGKTEKGNQTEQDQP